MEALDCTVVVLGDAIGVPDYTVVVPGDAARTEVAQNPPAADVAQTVTTGEGRSELIQTFIYQGSKGLSADAICRGEVYQAVDESSKPVTANGTDPSRKNEISRNDNSSKRLDHSSVTEHYRNIDTSGRAGSDNLVSAKAAELETDPETVSKKRGRKPNSLMNPVEGYDHSWICTINKDPKISHGKKTHEKGVDFSPSTTLVLKKAPSSSAQEGVTRTARVSSKTNASKSFSSPSASSLPGGDHSAQRRPKKKHSMMDQDDDRISKSKVLTALVENKAPQHADITAEVEPEDRSKPVTKKRKNSKLGHAMKEIEQTTQAPGCVYSEKEGKASIDTEERELRRTVVKIEASENWLPDDTTANKVITEASRKKKVISKSSGKESGKKESNIDEMPKRNLKRKLTTCTETESKGFRRGEELIGRKIKVWWPLDKMFYEGIVDSYDHIKKKHRVLYSDGDEELLNLKKENWKLIGNNDFPEGENDINRPMQENSSDLVQKVKDKKKESESAKRGKADSSARRSGAGSISSKIKARKRVKTVDKTTQDNSIGTDKPRKDASAKASKVDRLKLKGIKLEGEN
ncbi:uncharacterized protein LOC110821133 [Carica papaya]|uniref:uncharacterized protein LOC110821133 n=1 Tax=Carica papaya TaxID=3649 RepID=UPI000B8C7881|nr:uncharacterized protein LOC110821133 [Carica papaya]